MLFTPRSLKVSNADSIQAQFNKRLKKMKEKEGKSPFKLMEKLKDSGDVDSGSF